MLMYLVGFYMIFWQKKNETLMLLRIINKNWRLYRLVCHLNQCTTDCGTNTRHDTNANTLTWLKSKILEHEDNTQDELYVFKKKRYIHHFKKSITTFLCYEPKKKIKYWETFFFINKIYIVFVIQVSLKYHS